MMLLPNELIESIIDLLAYTPKFPDSDYSLKTQFQQATPELHALSVVNWHLRQISLRFLFANIKINSPKYVEMLRDHCYTAILSRYTKTLVISYSLGYSEEGIRILSHLVPNFKQLSCVELRLSNDRIALLDAILAHPTVSSVLVDQLPHESIYDLSKVILRETFLFPPFSLYLERCMNRGMRLACLTLIEPGSSNDKLPHFEGLDGIHIILGFDHISSSWLSALSSTNPSLKEIWLLDCHHVFFAATTITLMSSFFEESQRQNLNEKFAIDCACLHRSTIQDWHVVGLTICTTPASTSLIEILTLIASSFPKLEALTLNLYLCANTFDVDDLADVLACFSSLRVLKLEEAFKRLRSGSRCLPTVCRVNPRRTPNILAAHEASGLSAFTSRVRKKVSSLEAFYIDDTYSDGFL
ncbi:hypothetical protein F5890DRAFT_1567646 [Lentinula detonsa]|uniref:Uncharacterized protein n=1 Tax=Lentinula detonsa TaxID=2804962 RepID=A0AA38UPH2_9AGAR|nr:hypothetical protein F5890DRAFT_1567646 [Lentinula detonsa]